MQQHVPGMSLDVSAQILVYDAFHYGVRVRSDPPLSSIKLQDYEYCNLVADVGASFQSFFGWPGNVL